LHVIGGGTTGGVVTPVEADASVSGVAVPIATNDEVVSTLPGSSIDLLMIDAEGSEVAILRGGERTLDHVQRIMVEYHSRDLLRQVREILARKGFAQEMIVDYCAEDAAAGQYEVGSCTRDGLTDRLNDQAGESDAGTADLHNFEPSDHCRLMQSSLGLQGPGPRQ
jgi:hypothetical protein